MRGLVCADDTAVSSLGMVASTHPSYSDRFLGYRLADSPLHREYQQCFHFQLKNKKFWLRWMVWSSPHLDHALLCPAWELASFPIQIFGKMKGGFMMVLRRLTLVLGHRATWHLTGAEHPESHTGSRPLLLGTPKQATPLGCLQASSPLHPGYSIYWTTALTKREGFCLPAELGF